MKLVKLLLLLPLIACWTGNIEREVTLPKHVHKIKRPITPCTQLTKSVGQVPERANLDKVCGGMPDFNDDFGMRSWEACNAWYWSVYSSELLWWIDVAIAQCVE